MRTGEKPIYTSVPRGVSFHAVHLFCDLLALSLAWRATAEVRLWLDPHMSVHISRAMMRQVAPHLEGILALWLLASIWLRTYRDRSDVSFVAALFAVAKASMAITALTVLEIVFFRGLGADLSRSFVLLLLPMSFLFLVASLSASIPAARMIQRRWPSIQRLAVVGPEEEAGELLAAIRQDSSHESILCGLILPMHCTQQVLAGTARETPVPERRVPVLGTTRELAALINRSHLDSIMLASGALTRLEEEACVDVARRMGVRISRPIRRADEYVAVRHHVQYGMHIVDLEGVPFRRGQEVVKRAIDVAVSLTAITLLLPLIAAIAVLVLTTSEGPVFYKSLRVGKGGRHFTFWKFRSMYLRGPGREALERMNQANGHLFKIRRDPRVTPVGRVLRRLSLDELPQLFNVLAGDMSLVGPRPLPAEDLDPDGMSCDFAEWAQQRAMVPPGITGLWQVHGRSNLPFDRMMELDLAYVRNWSLGMDLNILAETPRAVLSGLGAY